MKLIMDKRWVSIITVLSVVFSVVFTFASEKALKGSGYLVSFIILLFFILLNILFDIIGTAVTAADEAPFHSMASHRQRGAAQAIWLVKNADKVSNFCSDVVGDIAGIISGTTSAVIVAKLVLDMNADNIVLQLCLSGLVAGLTIGGKAVGKALGISKSTEIVLIAGQIMNLFSRRKSAQKREGNR